MDYTLVKKLKESGFPQGGDSMFNSIGERIVCVGEDCYCPRCVYGMGDQFDIPSEEYYIIPTLSELIKACGEEFLGLTRRAETETKNSTVEWSADTRTHPCNCNNEKCRGYNWEYEVGSTPEEAVANLWLALNEK